MDPFGEKDGNGEDTRENTSRKCEIWRGKRREWRKRW